MKLELELVKINGSSEYIIMRLGLCTWEHMNSGKSKIVLLIHSDFLLCKRLIITTILKAMIKRIG